MEFDTFLEIRNVCCLQDPKITEGKMMSSPAIHFRGKVFAFFSRKKRMVFKLGGGYPIASLPYRLKEFNPFKTKGPLKGWYELPYQDKRSWEEMTHLALGIMKNENELL